MNRNQFNIKNFFLVIVCFVFVLSASGQNQIKKYVQENSHQISTINPDSTDFADLESLGNAIGDSKIVMLGEATHRDAPTYLAKTRIIKYLHEKKGFNVLAFESDFFGLNYGWDDLKKEAIEIDTFLRKNIFPIWTYCDACNDLFYKYIPTTYNTKNPLIVSGFDNQMTLNYSSKNLITKFDSVLRYLDLPITKSPQYSSEIIPLIDSLTFKYWYQPIVNESQLKKSGKYLNEIKNQAILKLNSDDFWMMVIDNFIQLNMEVSQYIQKNDNDTSRDYQMALNLKWLAEKKFATEKIIVWAASYHLAKREVWPEDQSKSKVSTMGSVFTKLNANTNTSYVIAFTSFEAEAYNVISKKFTYDKPNRNGFENWIDLTYNFSFVDFKKYNELFQNNSDSFYMKVLGHSNLKREWNKYFDGIFFVRKNYPCQKLK